MTVGQSLIYCANFSSRTLVPDRRQTGGLADQWDGILAYWNIEVLGFERIDPLFHHSNIPIFSARSLTKSLHASSQ
jgi:hypothetical protein